MNGNDVADVLTDKLDDPSLAVKVGGNVMHHIIGATHTGDGLVVIEYRDADEGTDMFQFSPSVEPFAQTAVNADGQVLCRDC